MKIRRFTPGFKLRRNRHVSIVPRGVRTLLQGYAEVLPPAGEPWHNKTEWLAAVRQMCTYYEHAGPVS